MSKVSSLIASSLGLSCLSLGLSAALLGGCTVAAKSAEEKSVVQSSSAVSEKTNAAQNLTKNSSSKIRIQITTGSPADTVRVFYKNLRERRFREAMMMTNLRAAVENLSEAEMQDLSRDFEALASQIPAEPEINGEIITNNLATVTAKLPDENGQLALKEHQMRRENNAWTILTADEKEEAAARAQGKNYFFTLRIETHHAEARRVMQDIVKAQMAYALQHNGTFADLPTLVAQNYMSADVQTVESTGYRFAVTPSSDKKKYYATAEPAVYGKSGKLSYLLELGSGDGKPILKVEDKKGASLKK